MRDHIQDAFDDPIEIEKKSIDLEQKNYIH